MKIALIVGTRPEIIKVSPLIRYCEKKGIEYFILHTGQHYSSNMDKIFFEELELPAPKHQLNIKSISPVKQGAHTGNMLIEIEAILLEESPDVVLVHGDTNTALAGALSAAKISTTKEYSGRNIKLGHIESGLRSYDRSMPEEINRVIVDHLSNVLFPPTPGAVSNLEKEGIPSENIVVTGNTIVDAVYENLEIAERKIDTLSELKIKKKDYILVTVHRQESVDVETRLHNIIEALVKVQVEFDLPVIYPMHPRTSKMIKKFNIIVPETIRIIRPVGFLEFLQLEDNAKLILTDSGGIQEEACILGVPCVTLRNNTERPETVESGANIIAGYSPENILKCARVMMDKKIKYNNILGDGNAAKLIIERLQQ
jgi:UDP-N-acetylglucosamine 2-epimerase (non-hydrolysing)